MFVEPAWNDFSLTSETMKISIADQQDIFASSSRSALFRRLRRSERSASSWTEIPRPVLQYTQRHLWAPGYLMPDDSLLDRFPPQVLLHSSLSKLPNLPYGSVETLKKKTFSHASSSFHVIICTLITTNGKNKSSTFVADIQNPSEKKRF